MGQIRIPKEGGKYWLPKQRFLTVYHYCLQYPEWEDEYNALRSAIGVSGVNYDGMPHGSGVGDPTSADTIRLADLDAGDCVMAPEGSDRRPALLVSA